MRHGRALVVALMAGLLAACGAGTKGDAPAPGAGAPGEARRDRGAERVTVRTALATASEPDAVVVPGSVESAHSASLGSRIAATIRSVEVEEGASVRRGQILARLDGRDIAARVAAAEARLTEARASRDRFRSLFKKEAATLQELEAAEAADAAAAADLEAARSQLDYVEIRAPFDGRVVARRMQAGDLASPGREILALQGNGPMRVSASVTAAQGARLALGRPVEALLDTGDAAPCSISVIGPADDEASRRALVKCDLTGSSRARAGSFARLRLPGGTAESMAMVPVDALFERGGLTGTFVVRDGIARLRWISPGERRGASALVRAGLAPGEEVVLSPAGLADGTPVATVSSGGRP